MLICDDNILIITINNIKIEVKVTFNVLRNLYNFLQDDISRELDVSSPFELLENLNEDNKYIAALLYCMSNGRIPYYDIKEHLKELPEIYFKLIETSVLNSLIYIDKNEEKHEGKEESQDFEEYFNFLYCSAITILHFTKEQFHETTPRELKALLNAYKLNQKNILLTAYIEVMKSLNKPTTKKEEVIKAQDANDFFNLI